MDPVEIRARTADVRAPESPDALLDRLCKHLAVEKGYAVLAIPEGEGARLHGVAPTDGFEWEVARIPELVVLAEHFDRILVRSDGYGFEVVCIKNRLADASRRVSMALEALREVGKQCLKYTGKVQGTQLPVSMKVWEVCSEAASETDHLRALRCMPMGQKVGISAWSLRPGSKTVWTNTRFNGLLAGRKYLESLLRKLGAGSDPSASVRVEVGEAIRYPALTYSLVAAMAVLYLVQLALGEFHGLLAPSVQSLVASGGLNRSLVIENGQWYRLVSAAFLHGDLFHLVLNGLALYLGGTVLESLLGRSWLLAIFGLSILGGSAASLLLNGSEMVSVGASGAIMGMLAAAFLVTFRLPYGQERSSAQMHLLYWLVPALIPLATRRSEGKIDFAAHFGGAIIGIALGVFILKSWRANERLPRFGRVAAVLAVGCAVLILASLGQAFAGRASIQHDLSLTRQLASNEDLRPLRERSPEQVEVMVRELRARFPRDPRISYFLTLAALDRKAAAEAEGHLKNGLAEQVILKAFFSDGKLESTMRTQLARLLLQRGADSEARASFQPACARVSISGTSAILLSRTRPG